MGDLLLVAGQAVHEQEGEAVPARRRERSLELAAQVLRERDAVRDLEPAQVVEMADRGAADAGREAHAGDAVVAAAERADLSRRRAADHRDAGEAARQLRRQGVAVVLAGAEEEHERHVRLPRPA